MKTCLTFILVLFISHLVLAQNSLVGDGFGGRKWYKPYNYTVGSYSAYAVCGAEKQLYAWGGNIYGQLGDSSFTPRPKPVKVLDMDHVKYYSTGYVMGAIKDDSTGWTWGGSNSSNPSASKVIDSVMFVDAGIFNCAFVKYDGTVWSVGDNTLGEFGNGQASNPFSKIPSQMLNINNAVRTAQGGVSTTVLLNDGTLRIAGNYNGNNYLTPIPININAFIVDIKANTYENIALDSTGDVWYWTSSSNPIKLTGLQNVVAISGCNDGFHFLFLDENHDCYALGDNSYGQCGLSSGNLITPTLVASNVNDIMAGEWFSYIVKSNGELYGSGTGLWGSIWLNIEDKIRYEFTKIDPTDTSINLCGIGNEGDFEEIIIPDPIIIQPILDTPIVFFPNVFSPNGDSKNDVFKAICADPSKVEKFDLRIFNRYGEQVFRTSAIDKGWDGKDHELSTYFYCCRYKQYSKNFLEAKGDFILLR